MPNKPTSRRNKDEDWDKIDKEKNGRFQSYRMAKDEDDWDTIDKKGQAWKMTPAADSMNQGFKEASGKATQVQKLKEDMINDEIKNKYRE